MLLRRSGERRVEPTCDEPLVGPVAVELDEAELDVKHSAGGEAAGGDGLEPCLRFRQVDDVCQGCRLGGGVCVLLVVVVGVVFGRVRCEPGDAVEV